MTSPAECVHTLHRRRAFLQPALSRLRAFMVRLRDATPFGAFGSFGVAVRDLLPERPPDPTDHPESVLAMLAAVRENRRLKPPIRSVVAVLGRPGENLDTLESAGRYAADQGLLFRKRGDVGPRLTRKGKRVLDALLRGEPCLIERWLAEGRIGMLKLRP